MLSIIILTKNEENNIADCLDTIPASWPVILIDDNSTDKTIDIAKRQRSDISVYKRDLEDNFSEQRNFGLSKAKTEWVLFLDADERLNEKLSKEIETKIQNNSYNGFYIKRVDNMWGRVLRHGELSNMWLLRLGKKNSGKWSGAVHEEWNISGLKGKLVSELIHFPHQTIREFLAEINHYSTIRAQELFKQKKTTNWFYIIVYPKAKFLQNYVLRQGYKDGTAGFVLAGMMSFHSFLVRGKLWLLSNQK